MPSSVGTAYKAILARCAGARLVAVSKLKTADLMRECYDVGCRHFGENYVQELCKKAPELPGDIRFHMIGPLQSNKCKMLAKVPNLWMVQSVHTPKLASTLDRAWGNRDDTVLAAAAALGSDFDGPLRVMLQVNTSGEASKSGCLPERHAVVSLARHVVEKCSNLQLMGLMTIGKLGEEAPECFASLLQCKSFVCDELGIESSQLEVSMGMSNDFELAIEHGSNMVRVGSSIFGARIPTLSKENVA